MFTAMFVLTIALLASNLYQALLAVQPKFTIRCGTNDGVSIATVDAASRGVLYRPNDETPLIVRAGETIVIAAEKAKKPSKTARREPR